MADENKGDVGADGIKQLKAEMDRKLTNIEQTSKKLEEALRSLNTAVAAKAAPPARQAEVTEDLEDLMITNPAKAAKIIKEQAKAEISEELGKQAKAQNKTSQVMSELISKYPELQYNDHELTQKAIEIYNALPDDEKTSASAYRLAVKEAAVELGIKERSKRSEGEDFVPSRTSTSQRRQKKEELDPATLEFARLMAEKGFTAVDPDKEGVKERLLARSKRNYGQFK